MLHDFLQCREARSFRGVWDKQQTERSRRIIQKIALPDIADSKRYPTGCVDLTRCSGSLTLLPSVKPSLDPPSIVFHSFYDPRLIRSLPVFRNNGTKKCFLLRRNGSPNFLVKRRTNLTCLVDSENNCTNWGVARPSCFTDWARRCRRIDFTLLTYTLLTC